MEVLPQLQKVQALVVEHAFMIGIGLLVAAVIAGFAWYWMSRGAAKSDVLVNQARVNSADMDPPPSMPRVRSDFPAAAMGGIPSMPSVPSEQVQENVAREENLLAQIEAQA